MPRPTLPRPIFPHPVAPTRSRVSVPHETSLAAGIGWSVAAAFFAALFLIPYRFAVEAEPRLTAMTAMFVVAAVFNAAIALAPARGRRLRIDRVAVAAAVLLAGCTIVSNLGIARAVVDIGAGMTSVVLKSQVVLTPILAWWLLQEKVRARFWVGAALALAGVALAPLVEQTASGVMAGYGWALLASVGFAAMQIITRRVITRIHPPVVNALRLMIAVLALQALSVGRDVWSMSVQAWGYAAAAGVLGPGLSRLSLMNAVRHVSPSVSALIALIGPGFAFALGAMFFDERPSAFEVTGAVMVVGSVVWSLWPQAPVKTAQRSSDT